MQIYKDVEKHVHPNAQVILNNIMCIIALWLALVLDPHF